jgi:hypothetical protein
MPFDRKFIAFGLFAAALAVMVWALLRYQGRVPVLETHTFELQHLDPHQAAQMIEPYVWDDRPDAPGSMSAVDNTLTVRETEDNLEKIARVLEEFDIPRPTVRLNFQLIEADGAAQGDPAISEVEAELRRLFRYQGYRLVNEAVVGGMEGSHIEQLVGEPSEPDEGWIIGGRCAQSHTRGIHDPGERPDRPDDGGGQRTAHDGRRHAHPHRPP